MGRDLIIPSLVEHEKDDDLQMDNDEEIASFENKLMVIIIVEV